MIIRKHASSSFILCFSFPFIFYTFYIIVCVCVFLTSSVPPLHEKFTVARSIWAKRS